MCFKVKKMSSTQELLQLYTTIGWIIILTVFLIIFLIVIIAYFYHKRLPGSDSVNWISLFLFFISFIDFITDILFFGELIIRNNKNESDLTLYTALFLFIPHGLSNIICIIYIIKWQCCLKNNKEKQYEIQNMSWLNKNSKFLILFTFLSNFFSSIELLNCGLFHFNIFNMQIINKYKNHIHIIHIIIDVFIGSFPLMIIQMAYMSLNGYSQISITIIAMIFSFISIAIGIFIIVSKVCNNLVDFLIPNNYDDNNNNKSEKKSIYRLIIIKSHELTSHHIYTNKKIKIALSQVLQISDYQIKTIYIEKCNDDSIKYKLKINPEINDENLYLFLNLLETPSSGLYDLLKQEICNKLCLNDIANLNIFLYQTNQYSLQPIGDYHHHHNINNNNNAQIHNVHSDSFGPTDSQKNIIINNDNKTWKCNKCTFENHYLIENCQACGAEKPIDWDQYIKDNQQQQPYNVLIHHIEQESDDNKKLLDDIEQDNKNNINDKDGGGPWTGDHEHENHDDINHGIDDIPNVDVEIEVSVDLMSNNDEENADLKQSEDIEDIDDIMNGITPKDIDISQHNNNNNNDIIIPSDKDDDDDDDESDMKQEEEDRVELFDNRYTNDGLNDDFDGLREPDVFG